MWRGSAPVPALHHHDHLLCVSREHHRLPAIAVPLPTTGCGSAPVPALHHHDHLLPLFRLVRKRNPHSERGLFNPAIPPALITLCSFLFTVSNNAVHLFTSQPATPTYYAPNEMTGSPKSNVSSFTKATRNAFVAAGPSPEPVPPLPRSLHSPFPAFPAADRSTTLHA